MTKINVLIFPKYWIQTFFKGMSSPLQPFYIRSCNTFTAYLFLFWTFQWRNINAKNFDKILSFLVWAGHGNLLQMFTKGQWIEYTHIYFTKSIFMWIICNKALLKQLLLSTLFYKMLVCIMDYIWLLLH